jgi:dimethylglycine dehydrogenase
VLFRSLHVPTSDLRKIYQALMTAGQSLGVADFGLYALNSLRMEKAYRGFGSELTNEISLVEAGMDRFYSLKKADFVGKSGIERRLRDGVAIKLVYLAVDAPHLDVLGQESVWTDDKLVGAVTTGGFGYAVGKTLAFAYVKSGFASPGAVLNVEMNGRRYAAEVLAVPAYDPENLRMRA